MSDNFLKALQILGAEDNDYFIVPPEKNGIKYI